MSNPISLLKQQLDNANIWSEQRTLERNEHLKVQGSTDTHIYYVLEGSLRVYLIEESEELTIRFGYEGSFITALDSFISEQPSPFYIQALKKTEILVADKTTYMNWVHSHPDNLKLWLTLTEGLVLQQLEREQDLLTTSPTQRYERVLKRSPKVFQEIPHKYIASYLRMTPETLSRIKKS